MKLKSKYLATIIFLILFGGIIVTTGMGWWQTERSKVPIKLAEGKMAGSYDPADIRGSYTFGEISDLFNIPLTDLGTAFQIPDENNLSGFELKELEEIYTGLPFEIGTGSVRLFTALYHGLPYTPSEDTYLLTQAVDILERQGFLTEEQKIYLATHSVELAVITTDQTKIDEDRTPIVKETSVPVPTNTGAADHTTTDRKVNGTSTFQDLIDWGVTSDKIETILGASMPLPDMVIKDFCTENDLLFSNIKIELQALVIQ